MCGFLGFERRFAELLRILETKGESVGGVVLIALLLNLRGEFGYEGAAPADGLAVRFGSWQGGLANLRDEFGSEVHGADRQLAMEFPLGLGLVLVEEAFEEGDGVAEGVVECHEQVDVVEVFLAAKAVGEVVAWVDGGAHFAAIRTEEVEVALAHFGGGPVAAQGGDGDGHGQVIA